MKPAKSKSPSLMKPPLNTIGEIATHSVAAYALGKTPMRPGSPLWASSRTSSMTAWTSTASRTSTPPCSSGKAASSALSCGLLSLPPFWSLKSATRCRALIPACRYLMSAPCGKCWTIRSLHAAFHQPCSEDLPPSPFSLLPLGSTACWPIWLARSPMKSEFASPSGLSHPTFSACFCIAECSCPARAFWPASFSRLWPLRCSLPCFMVFAPLLQLYFFPCLCCSYWSPFWPPPFRHVAPCASIPSWRLGKIRFTGAQSKVRRCSPHYRVVDVFTEHPLKCNPQPTVRRLLAIANLLNPWKHPRVLLRL